MTNNRAGDRPVRPTIHHRRSIRLSGYDYTQAGAYFITLCTHERKWLFGKIVVGEMRLNEYGRIVQDEWEKTQQIRTEIELGPSVIMPNHFHGIILISGTSTDQQFSDTNTAHPISGKGTARRAPTRPALAEQFGKPIPGSIPTIVRAFKSAVSRRVNQLLHTPGAPVWQRNYYEHIIRDEKSYVQIAEYIQNNPLQWQLDKLYTG